MKLDEFKNLPQSVEEMQDIIGIADVYASPWASVLRGVFWGVIAFFVVLFLAWIFSVLFKKWKAKRNKLSPEDRALNGLKELYKKDLLRQERENYYYFLLDHVLRTYLDQRFNLDVLDDTFEELEGRTEDLSVAFKEKDMKWLRQFWGRSQMIKFARKAVSEEEARGDLRFIEKFILRAKKDVQTQEEQSK